MTTFLSADALRVARALVGASQRQVAEKALITQKAVWVAENSDQPGKAVNARLRFFYEGLGIEFLGTIDLSTEIAVGLGARWKLPPQLPIEQSAQTEYHAESAGIALAAARALLNRTQSEIARSSGISQRQVSQLETGLSLTQSSLARLREFYESESVEFLGWGDVTSTLFYGVGVRWKQTQLIKRSQ